MNNKLYIAVFFFTIEDKSKYKAEFSSKILPQMVKEITGESEFLIGKMESGKPFFIKPEAWFYNISHSAQLGVCAIGKEDLGVDIECNRKKGRDIQTIAKTWFTASENKFLEKDLIPRNELFYHLWTRKESYIKLKGLSVWNMKRTPNMAKGSNRTKSWEISYNNDMFSLSLTLDKLRDIETDVSFYTQFIDQEIKIKPFTFS